MCLLKVDFWHEKYYFEAISFRGWIYAVFFVTPLYSDGNVQYSSSVENLYLNSYFS